MRRGGEEAGGKERIVVLDDEIQAFVNSRLPGQGDDIVQAREQLFAHLAEDVLSRLNDGLSPKEALEGALAEAGGSAALTRRQFWAVLRGRVQTLSGLLALLAFCCVAFGTILALTHQQPSFGNLYSYRYEGDYSPGEIFGDRFYLFIPVCAGVAFSLARVLTQRKLDRILGWVCCALAAGSLGRSLGHSWPLVNLLCVDGGLFVLCACAGAVVALVIPTWRRGVTISLALALCAILAGLGYAFVHAHVESARDASAMLCIVASVPLAVASLCIRPRSPRAAVRDGGDSEK